MESFQRIESRKFSGSQLALSSGWHNGRWAIGRSFETSRTPLVMRDLAPSGEGRCHQIALEAEEDGHRRSSVESPLCKSCRGVSVGIGIVRRLLSWDVARCCWLALPSAGPAAGSCYKGRPPGPALSPCLLQSRVKLAISSRQLPSLVKPLKNVWPLIKRERLWRSFRLIL